MRAFNFLKEMAASKETSGFIPFTSERDNLGNLQHKKKCFTRTKKISEHIFDRKTSSTKISQKSNKARFLKEIYSTHGNSDWCSLTHLRKQDKKFQFNIETVYQEQKQLDGINKQFHCNDGIIRRFTPSTICSSPKLGKNKTTDNQIPPLGYYQPKEILRKSPMLVFMDQQLNTLEKFHKTSRTEASTAIPNFRQKLSPNNRSPVPLEIYENAIKTERKLTDLKYKYVPQMIDEKNLEKTAQQINNIREKVLRHKQTSLYNL